MTQTYKLAQFMLPSFNSNPSSLFAMLSFKLQMLKKEPIEQKGSELAVEKSEPHIKQIWVQGISVT